MNISNSLSILRIILSIPIAYLIFNQQIEYAIFLGVIAGLTDFLDGFLARKLNQITDLGKILDPIADKILVSLVVITMLINEMLPLWFFVVVVLRDIMILIGGLWIKKKYGIVLSSNFEGKATFLLIILTILGVLLEIEYATRYGYYLCMAAIVYSFSLYLFRGIKVIQENDKKN